MNYLILGMALIGFICINKLNFKKFSTVKVVTKKD